mgnify:CR=1 FL=1
MKEQPSLDVPDFQKMVESLCAEAVADFAAARSRLERLRRVGPDDDRDGAAPHRG